MAPMDPQLLWLLGGVLTFLVLATVVGLVLERRVEAESARATIRNLNARIWAWWVMCAVFGLGLLLGGPAPVLLFGCISVLALREFLTLTPTRRGDHRSLFWIFFVITPLQYVWVGLGWIGLFSGMIPIFAFLLIPTRGAIAGDPDGFLSRTATMQWGLMVCVYCVSHAPAILGLRIPGYEGQNAKLLFLLVLIVQASDVLQYVWGKLLGRRKIAPRISPNKTWEGFLGGLGSATLLGACLWWATPFRPWQAAGLSLAITLLGFAGGLTMSAIKRDLGVKDYGTLIPGHGGILDRIDSLCFAAPVFYHAARFLLI
ncbi:MAG TPA: phosphatidate cytidylyltransferase [Candidatus Methylomirabilis sp.]|nr:phosphatidate cytidylyltransferase [Candidatus Methylomirabilis sp.]